MLQKVGSRWLPGLLIDARSHSPAALNGPTYQSSLCICTLFVQSICTHVYCVYSFSDKKAAAPLNGVPYQSHLNHDGEKSRKNLLFQRWDHLCPRSSNLFLPTVFYFCHLVCLHYTKYESFATVGEIRVYWRADFQSGSRVLKKVF